MKSIDSKQIYYIVALCLLFIFGSQAYLGLDYYQTTRSGLVRETNAIIEMAFQQELDIRHKKFRHLNKEDSVSMPPLFFSQNTLKIYTNNAATNKNNVVKSLDLIVNTLVSKMVPLNLDTLDKITGQILQSRNIHSKYLINIVEPTTSKIEEQSKKELPASSFLIPSKYLSIDFENSQALQLVLVNPFGVIIKRMGLMLITTLVLSIICLLAFQMLHRILARQKQLVAFKNEFLSTIAHEMKRPVSSLSLQLECMAMPAYSGNPQQQELLLSRSMHATAELNDTINMIVALAKLEEGLLTLNREAVNLTQLFDKMKSRFVSYPVKKVEIRTVYAPDEIFVSGDRQLLNQCFANLIDNAIKYSGEEVLIEVTISKTGNLTIVSIKDNGYGIPEDQLSVIFEKYSRAHTEHTKINGFGIGLNYVKTIVEKHKGKVEVKSQPGQGSEFSVMLPG